MYVLIAEVIPFYGLNVPLDKDYLELFVRGSQRKLLPYHIKKRIIYFFLVAVTYHRTILELKVTMKFVPVFFNLYFCRIPSLFRAILHPT